MRTERVIIALLMLTIAAISGTAQQDTLGAAARDDGLVTVESDRSVDQTVTDIRSALEENGFFILAVVSHDRNAAEADMTLRPTRLIIFGNPKIGTQLMQREQTVGIDLPQKFLVWEDEDGRVRVTYNDPRYLAERHGIDASEIPDLLDTISGALSRFAVAGR